jgi:hypothetical protein
MIVYVLKCIKLMFLNDRLVKIIINVNDNIIVTINWEMKEYRN